MLGEGSFLALLHFLREHAPDARSPARSRASPPRTRPATSRSGSPTWRATSAWIHPLRGRLATAVERRHAALAHTAGLNADVCDALVLLAAGSWAPADLRRGHAAVVALAAEMDAGRRARLARLGFEAGEAAALSALHTRNFM